MQQVEREGERKTTARRRHVWSMGILFLTGLTIATMSDAQALLAPSTSDFIRGPAPAVAPSDFWHRLRSFEITPTGAQGLRPLRTPDEYRGSWRGLELRGPAPVDFVAKHAERAVELYLLADFEKAKREIQEAIKRADVEQDVLRRAVAIDFRGLTERMLGQLTDAIDSHQKAIEMLEGKTGNEEDLLNAKGNLAIGYYYRGDYQKALKLLTEIEKGSADPVTWARVLNNSGLIYQELGALDHAEKEFASAAVMAKGLENWLLRAESLNNQARVVAAKGETDKAIPLLAEAQQLARKLQMPQLEANILDSWAHVLLEAGRYESALAKLDEAVRLEAKAPSPLIKPVIHLNQGRSFAGLGRTAEAFDEYQRAVQLSADIGLEAVERQGLSHRADLYRNIGKLNEAIADYKVAVDIVESTRARLTAETEREFISATQGLYSSLIESLISQEKFEEAFDYLERSKSKALQDSIRKVHLEIRDLDAKKIIEGAKGLLDQEEALREQLQRERTAGVPKKEVIEKLERQLRNVKRNFATLLADLKKRYGDRYTGYVSIPAPNFVRLKDLLPPGTLLIAFLPMPDFLIFFLVSRDADLEWRRNDAVKKAELDRAIQRYRGLMDKVRGPRSLWRIDSWTDPQWKELRETTIWLYSALLEPISDRISKAERVIFVPTGLLYYLPIHALGKADQRGEIQFTITQKPVSYLTNSELLSIVQERTTPPGQKSLFAFGNPIVQHTEPPLKLLPHAEEEVKALKRVFGEKAYTLVREEATRQALLNVLSPPKGKVEFGFILLATHGILNSQSPADSWLALDGTNKLVAKEVPSLDLSTVSLVTLSACETVLEGDNPGNDLMGLAFFFSQAETPSIVASLWAVDDVSTHDLMVTFHKTMVEQETLDKARALQQAQVALASKPETRHPFFWAPFILIGDWR